MKKKSCAYLLLSAVLCSCHAQKGKPIHPPVSDLKEMYMLGKVRQVCETLYILKHKAISRYTTSWSDMDSAKKDSVKYSITEDFDENGTRIKFTNEEYSETYTYTYDMWNYKLTSTMFTTNGNRVHRLYKYDTAGNNIKMDEYEHGKPDSLEFTQHYKYDRKGNKIWEFAHTFHQLGNPQASHEIEYSYDSLGNIIESDVPSPDPGIKYSDKKTFTYDGSGLVITETDYGADNILLHRIAYQYIKDSNNNWTTRLELIDGVTDNLNERKISYYQ